MSSVDYLEENQSSVHGQAAVNQLAPDAVGSSLLTVGRGNSAENESSTPLSPIPPSLVHLPLCRTSAPVVGLKYRNLGKSGLRISNVGLGNEPAFNLAWFSWQFLWGFPLRFLRRFLRQFLRRFRSWMCLSSWRVFEPMKCFVIPKCSCYNHCRTKFGNRYIWLLSLWKQFCSGCFGSR